MNRRLAAFSISLGLPFSTAAQASTSRSPLGDAVDAGIWIVAYVATLRSLSPVLFDFLLFVLVLGGVSAWFTRRHNERVEREYERRLLEERLQGHEQRLDGNYAKFCKVERRLEELETLQGVRVHPDDELDEP